MSEVSTFELGYQSPERIHETVIIDDTISYIDILLPQHHESWQDGMRWVNAIQKALRINRIDERSLVLSDLSSLDGNHAEAAPLPESECGLPYDVMDVYPDEPYMIGREHNPSKLPILSNELVSRHHLSITPRLGEMGLSLTFLDTRSVNGSRLRVHRTLPSVDPAYEQLFA